MTDLERAKQLLLENEYSCVLVKEDSVICGEARGIRALLVLIAARPELEGYSAADRIVGKAAALMYKKAGVSTVWAQVMSRPGRDVLEESGIGASFGKLTDMIANRAGDGCCPMEETVAAIDDPQEAYEALCKKTGVEI